MTTGTRVVTVSRRLRQEAKVCAACRKEFWGIATRRYCSRSCQNKVYWQRHAEVQKLRRITASRAATASPLQQEDDEKLTA